MSIRDEFFVFSRFFSTISTVGLIRLTSLLSSIVPLFSVLFHIMVSYVTIGAVHRYYAHQAFVAIGQLRFFLVLAHTVAGVVSVSFRFLCTSSNRADLVIKFTDLLLSRIWPFHYRALWPYISRCHSHINSGTRHIETNVANLVKIVQQKLKSSKN